MTAEDPWESLPELSISLSEQQRLELLRRRELHQAEPERGRPWREVLDEIERSPVQFAKPR